MGGPSTGAGNNSIYASNISLTDNGKNYYGTYFQDDWKVSPKLTLNLGLRWDFFGLVYEHHSNQANFVPSGPPTGGPMYIIPTGPNAGNLSPSFTSLLAQDGIDVWPSPTNTVRDWATRRRRTSLRASVSHTRSPPN